MLDLSTAHYQNRKLENLVENRTVHTLKNAELNIFETHLQASQVLLKFQQPVLASMLKGKKIMHLADSPAFGFLPGESVILPANELMCIDFPEASLKNPTKCLAMAFDQHRLDKIIDNLNEIRPKIDNQEWKFTNSNFHFTNKIKIK